MNTTHRDMAKTKLYLGALLAAVTAGLSALGYGQAAQCVTVVGSAMLAALGMNAIGAGLKSGGDK